MFRWLGSAFMVISVLGATAPAVWAGDATSLEQYVAAGPYLMGDEAVWSARSPDAPATILAAAPGQAPRTVWTAPAGCPSEITRMSASDTAIAAQLSTQEGETCDLDRAPFALRPDGTPIDRPVPPEGCAGQASDVDLDGDRLAVSWWNCDAADVTITDLSTGEVESAKFATPPDDAGIALAGRYVAAEIWGRSPWSMEIAVTDLDAGREVYRVDLEALQHGSSTENAFDLQADGTLAVIGSWFHSSGHDRRLIIASPTSPPRVVPIDPRHEGKGWVAIADGRVALNAYLEPWKPARPALLDLATGTVVPVGDGSFGDPLAWNGKRIVWVERPAWNARIFRNQTLAEVMAAAAAAATPTAPAVPAAPANGAAPATPAKRRCRVPRLRGATVAVARRKLARAGCRLGRISRRRAVAARRSKIATQSPRAGRVRSARTRVHVTLR